ncbi:MAG: ATP-binding protein, partial [Rhodothermales bacterium]|nr:ATP-binding protein [Rhodothermales bacterium]
LHAKQQAEAEATVHSRTMAGLSHELRTPLTSIIGFASVLQEDLQGEEKEFAARIHSSGERLLATVNALLDMAHLQAELVELKPTEIDVLMEARRVVEALRPEADAKGLFVRVLPETASVPARLDPSCLDRILRNLVGNAVKFTDEGGVTVLVDATEADVFLTVRDTGIGIREEFLPDLFDEFQQASTGYRRSYEGSGLGLAITQRMVHLLGGDIEVDSSEGGGTVFRIRLPRFDDRENGSPAEEAPLALEGQRVLLVEDPERSLQRLRYLLEPLCSLEGVEGMAEALEAARHRAYDLVLIDGHLDPPPGYESALGALRAQPGTAEAPAVAVTVHRVPGDRDRFLEEGFAGHLSKPFTKRRILLGLEGVLGLRVPV